MSVQKATDAYSNLISTASKFLSPSIKSFFLRKAEMDFKNSKNLQGSEISKYIEEQNSLREQLQKVIGIYNEYRDDTTTL